MNSLLLILGVALNGGFLALVCAGDRTALLRPGIVFHIAFFLQVQVGLALAQDLMSGLDLDPQAMAMRYLFVPLVISASIYMLNLRAFRKMGSGIWDLIRAARGARHRIRPAGAGPLGVIALACLVLYVVSILWYVFALGWHNTPLHALLSLDPNASWVREQGLKLLDNRMLAYGLTLAISYFGPAFAAILGMRYVLRLGAPTSLRWHLAALMTLALPATVAGSRASAGMIVVVGCFVYLVAQPFRRRLLVLPLMLLVVFGIPYAMFMIRMMGSSPDAVTFGMAAANLADRFFMRGLEAELWQAAYTERFGTFGLAGIPRLAILLGTDPVDIFNRVGTFYRPGSPTISASASFVTVNHSVWGQAGPLVTFLQLWLLEWVVLAAARLRPLLAWFLSTLWILPAILLSATAFESLFIGRGGALSILLLLALWLAEDRRRRHAQRAARHHPVRAVPVPCRVDWIAGQAPPRRRVGSGRSATETTPDAVIAPAH